MTTFTAAIAQSTDDAEHYVDTGVVQTGSSDLELGYEATPAKLNWVGLRFQNVTIPKSATILSAYVQFEVDEVSTGASPTLTIYGHKTGGDSFTHTTTAYSIRDRARTTASVNWSSIPAWNNVGDRGVDQRTPSLTAIVQEIVNQVGWVSGYSMSFMLDGSASGTNWRIAKSWDTASGTGAASLHIEYTTAVYGTASGSVSVTSSAYGELAPKLFSGSTAVDAVYIGSDLVDRVYVGGARVF